MAPVLFIVLAWALAACATADSGPPVGDPKMPDLVAEPPVEVRTRPTDDGRVFLLFTSTLVNVGVGDFILEGRRRDSNVNDWEIEQRIEYTASGVDVTPVDASMVWGGDGHEHWHVDRVAVYWLEAVDEDREPTADLERRFDSKVGFCFFDSHHTLGFGPEESEYDHDGCGKEDSKTFSVGLSRGWSDVYAFFLPGQEIDITGLRDGMYRLWAEADAQGWFHESNTDNNATWVDIDLGTREEDGARLAVVVAVGPRPGEV